MDAYKTETTQHPLTEKITLFKQKDYFLGDPFALFNAEMLRNEPGTSREMTCIYSDSDSTPTSLSLKAQNYVHGMPEVALDFWDLKNVRKIDMIQVVRKNYEGWCNYRSFKHGQNYMMTFHKGKEFFSTQNPSNLEIISEGEYGIILPNVEKKGFIIKATSNEDVKELFWMADKLYKGVQEAIKEVISIGKEYERVMTGLLFKSP